MQNTDNDSRTPRHSEKIFKQTTSKGEKKTVEQPGSFFSPSTSGKLGNQLSKRTKNPINIYLTENERPKIAKRTNVKAAKKNFSQKETPFQGFFLLSSQKRPLGGETGKGWGRKTHYCFQILSPLSVFFAGWCLLLIKWDFPYTRAGTSTHKVKHGPTRQKGRKGLFLRLFFWGAWFTAGLTFPSRTVQHFSWSGEVFSLRQNKPTNRTVSWVVWLFHCIFIQLSFLFFSVQSTSLR